MKSRFLVPTVLRGNPYLVSRGKIGMYFDAGAVGTRKTVIFDLMYNDES
jgi:hypothetical protein